MQAIDERRAPVGVCKVALLAAGILGLAGAPASADDADLTRWLPPGAALVLELEDTAALEAALSDPTSRPGRLLGSELGRRFLASKLPRKLGGRVAGWLSAAFPEVGMKEIGRHLLGGRGALAVYDLAEVRFAYALEATGGTRLAALLGRAQGERRKLAVGGRELEAVEAGAMPFYVLSRPGGFVLGNHLETMRKAAGLVDGGASLGESPELRAALDGVPAGLLRAYVPAATFDSVYMRSYWVGGGASRPPPQALGTSLRRLADGSYEEVRRRVGASVPSVALGALHRWVPAWTSRELGHPGDAEALLGAVLPAPETPRGEAAWKALAARWAAWVGAATACGRAGGTALVPAPKGEWGEAPEDGFSGVWPPDEGLHSQALASLALAYPEGALPETSEVRKAFAEYLGAYLGQEGAARVEGDAVRVPLMGDLVPWVGTRDGALLVVAGGRGREQVLAGSGGALGPEGASLANAYSVDVPRWLEDARRLEDSSKARDGWYARQRGPFAQRTLIEPVEGALEGLVRVEGSTRAVAGGAEDRVRFVFSSR